MEQPAQEVMMITRQQLEHALSQVPSNRWGDVLQMLKAFNTGSAADPDQPPPVLSGKDLLGSDLIGIWAEREDIADSREFARQLRQQASHRQGSIESDAVGH